MRSTHCTCVCVLNTIRKPSELFGAKTRGRSKTNKSHTKKIMFGQGRGRGRGRGRVQGGQDPHQQPIPYLDLSPDDVLKLGLKFVGFNETRQSKVGKKKNIERFRAFFGIGYAGVAVLLKDLQSSERTRVHKLDLKYFFLALNYLKTYNTELVMSGWWDLHEDTVHQWSWFYIKKIQQLKEEKVCPVVCYLDSIH
jgi:hypothetical protein